MDFDREQKEILDLSAQLDKIHGRSWYKYKGDRINRKIIKLLNPYVVKEKCSIAGPSVYISRCPTEFDALIVKENSTPLEGTNEYKLEDVKLLIEIKKHGFYFKKIEGKYEINNYFQQFRSVGKPFIYLTVKESQKFINMTKEVLKDNSFFLCVSNGEPKLEE